MMSPSCCGFDGERIARRVPTTIGWKLATKNDSIERTHQRSREVPCNTLCRIRQISVSRNLLFLGSCAGPRNQPPGTSLALLVERMSRDQSDFVSLGLRIDPETTLPQREQRLFEDRLRAHRVAQTFQRELAAAERAAPVDVSARKRVRRDHKLRHLSSPVLDTILRLVEGCWHSEASILSLAASHGFARLSTRLQKTLLEGLRTVRAKNAAERCVALLDHASLETLDEDLQT